MPQVNPATQESNLLGFGRTVLGASGPPAAEI